MKALILFLFLHTSFLSLNHRLSLPDYDAVVYIDLRGIARENITTLSPELIEKNERMFLLQEKQIQELDTWVRELEEKSLVKECARENHYRGNKVFLFLKNEDVVRKIYINFICRGLYTFEIIEGETCRKITVIDETWDYQKAMFKLIDEIIEN